MVVAIYFFFCSVLVAFGNDVIVDPMHIHDEEMDQLEKINHKAFIQRVVGTNYTKEKINGEHIKYYVTKEGDWHLDACTVIGHENFGLLGDYKRMVETERRRLNPYVATNGLGGWKNGIVYYYIDHPTIRRANWDKAIAHYHQYSPIRFIEFNPANGFPTNYIRVFQGSGCYGTLGRNPGNIANKLSLGSGCDIGIATIVHEIGHNLGFHHTQKRSDRNKYIQVLEQNIDPKYLESFTIVNAPVCGYYDCSSVMHYFDTAFSINRQKTLVSLDPSRCVIRKDYENPLSRNDRYCLCKLYPPGKNGAAAASSVCGSPLTPTIRVTPAPTFGTRSTISCKQSVTGSIRQNGVMSYNFKVSDAYYVYMFYSCYSTTNFDIDISITTQNGLIKLPSSDYTEQYSACDKTKHNVQLLWKRNSNWVNGNTYTMHVRGINGAYGNYQISMFCYLQSSSALNFGKNDEGDNVNFGNFKNYGALQWLMFFGIIFGVCLINVVVIFFIFKWLLKRKKSQWKIENENNNMINQNDQPNIQMVEDDEDGHVTTSY